MRLCEHGPLEPVGGQLAFRHIANVNDDAAHTWNIQAVGGGCVGVTNIACSGEKPVAGDLTSAPGIAKQLFMCALDFGQVIRVKEFPREALIRLAGEVHVQQARAGRADVFDEAIRGQDDGDIERMLNQCAEALLRGADPVHLKHLQGNQAADGHKRSGNPFQPGILLLSRCLGFNANWWRRNQTRAAEKHDRRQQQSRHPSHYPSMQE
ncbi:MAG TPA: hypothetical protein VEH27_02885 [Methylomirabilota bacterium]|nr:hypothetical protein [Methylomirabilota bacterium]